MLPDPLPDPARLAPLPYHDAVVRYLESEEPDVWRWACSAQARDDHARTVRSELLKQTYRLDAQAHRELHQRCAQAVQRLGLQVSVTLYQSADGPMNAALYYVPGEAHVVLTGPVLERLDGDELQAVLGHELAHYKLWELAGGIYHTADRVLGATADDPRAGPSHLNTARLYRLFTEAYADRGGSVACAGLNAAITALVKTQTGLTAVSAASYLQQADEICAAGVTAAGTSHPEVFVRARALRLWVNQDAQADTWLATALQGPPALQRLDLTAQQQLSMLTRRVLEQLLRSRCLHSDALLGHARQFFADLAPDPTAPEDATLASALAQCDADARRYFACVLLDLATADPELDDVPLAAALLSAARLDLSTELDALLVKDLGMAARPLQRLKQDAAGLLERAEARHG